MATIAFPTVRLAFVFGASFPDTSAATIHFSVGLSSLFDFYGISHWDDPICCRKDRGASFDLSHLLAVAF
jgi:hypothetical protein